MTPERWRQVTDVFHAARSRDASARAQYLDHACAGDRALRDEVDAVLAAHHDVGRFGGGPVSESIDVVRRLETGAMVGPYRIDRLIGPGGMGEVYRARDTKLGRDVAIKVLPGSTGADGKEHRLPTRQDLRVQMIQFPLVPLGPRQHLGFTRRCAAEPGDDE